MDPRPDRQALRARLTAARIAFDAGDRGKALEHVYAALAVDPNFLVAHWLRERVTAPAEPAVSTLIGDTGSATSARVKPLALEAPLKRSLVSAEGYARFEERTKRRRIDRRVDAARVALRHRHIQDAAAALAEVIELDPNLPELSALTAELARLRRTRSTTHRGPRIAAAAVFVIITVSGSWLRDPHLLLSRVVVGPAALVAPPALTVTTIEATPITTMGRRESPIEATVPTVRPVASQPVTDSPVAAQAPTTRPMTPRMNPAVTPPPVPVAPVAELGAVPVAPLRLPPAGTRPVQGAPEIAAMASPAVPTPISVPRVDDELLVKQTLQRYRSAYEGLDARSARVVYPALNQTALARAFDGLLSQSLTFDVCDVRLRGGSAAATCRGSARYVPRIGSHEPHTEPRVWSFTLRKNGDDWKIENARTER